MNTLNLLTAGFAEAVGSSTLLMALLGVLIGMLLGLIPGLSGVTGMALLLPFAFQFEAGPGLALLIGMYVASTITDDIPAILLGIPGTGASQAHILDGYPLTKAGHGHRAIGAAFAANLLGMTITVAVVILIYPFMSTIALSLGSPELFMIVVFGISLVGLLSGDKDTRVRGLMMGAFGILISTVGLSVHTGAPRYTFGSLYLWQGVGLVPAILGLFGISELVTLFAGGQPVSQEELPRWRGQVRLILGGMREVFRHKVLVLRASVLGGFIGFVPGIGGSVADWFGYGQAVQSARDKSQFGKGDIRGVIGPEAAVSGAKPVSILPTIVFGIPGSVPLAILLGGLLVFGIRPGPSIVERQPSLLFFLMWLVIIANVVGVILAIIGGAVLVNLTRLKVAIIAPFIITFLLVGSIASSSNFGDVVTFFVFGLVGWAMDQSGWPKPPLVLGLVLGRLAEVYLFVSISAHGMNWIYRPVVLLLAILMVAPGLLPAWRKLRRRTITDGSLTSRK